MGHPLPKSNAKYENLKKSISKLGNTAVAFSGGVDSTFLLKVAKDILENNVIAITANSGAFPKRELSQARAFCKKEKIKHFVFKFNEFGVKGFAKNPPNRCYLCKKELFKKILEIAKANGITNVVEASNADDINDYRPGMKAIAELGIKSPLKEAGFSKKEIRAESKKLGLPTFSKPSFACLATRFPYGEKITAKKLSMIDRAEQFLLNLGLKQVRVRHHGDVARIEADETGFEILMDSKTRKKINDKLKKIGFSYVAVDILGYRTGSMNETLK